MERKHIFKWILYGLTAIFFTTLQTRVFTSLRVFGAAPLFGAALTVCAAVLEGGRGGAFFGLFCGALQYMSPGGSELIYMLVYMTGGFFIGEICAYMFRRRLATALLWSLALNAAATLVYFIFRVWLPRRAGLAALAGVGLAEIIYSTAAVLPVYPVVREIAARFAEKELI